MGNMGASVTQTYFGRTIFMHSNVDAVRAREVLARNHGFTMVPPEGVDIIDENTDTSTFIRFTYDDCGIRYMGIIDTLISYTEEDGLLCNDGMLYDMPYHAHEEDVVYIKEYYREELEAKLESLKAEPAEASAEDTYEAVVVEEEDTGESVAISTFSEGNTVYNEGTSSTISIHDNLVDISRAHIPDDGFMQRPTPDNPLTVTVEPEPVMVNPLPAQVVNNPDIILGDPGMLDLSEFIYVNFPYLSDMELKIIAGNDFRVTYGMHSGLVDVRVASVDKPLEILNNYSLTIDVNGFIVNKDIKWWPGINYNNQNPVDFQKAYKYDLDAIGKYLAGEEIPDEYISYDAKIGELNKVIDLRTIYNVQEGISEEDAQHMFMKLKDAVDKLSARIQKECPNVRFALTKYANKDNFEVEATTGMYDFIGGQVANRNIVGVAPRIQVVHKKAPRLLK